ncbi:AAA family ATPase [Acetobacter sp. LMG 32666]|uniref:ATP-dependent nuclease n=1 Tax=Acetobacter sp. LMG 32666 TaxID=2959295 RepID=UPI0030C7B884
MKIISARIRNYRTVLDEVLPDLDKGLTLVGPNNAGKTNLLKAIRLFFTGYNNSLGYNRESDLSFGQGRNQTNISITFRIEQSDSDEINNIIENITELLKVDKPKNNEITVYLTFSSSSNPIYRVYPNSKRPTIATTKASYSRFERSFMDIIFNKFSVHYIPSDKSSEQLYNDLILPFLLKKAFSALTPHMTIISSAMDSVAKSFNLSLQKASINGLKSSFTFPSDPNRFFKEVDFSLSDPEKTSIFSKGMGIQSAAILSSFNWITLEEIKDDKNVIWLLEEPESYLHPELASQCDRMIDELRDCSQVICTTHSLGFVPQDPRRTLGIERLEGWTKAHVFKTYYEATNKIRKSLGVKFSDFYNLNHFNVIVEGETDREYLEFFGNYIKKINRAIDFPIITSKAISYLDQGGVTGLEGFVRATYQFIREERPCVILIDGDAAGDKCRKALQGFLGQKRIPFEANKNFIIIRDRFAIEGLFPDNWISELYDKNPNWFDGYAIDAEGKLMPFSVVDGHKRQFMTQILAKIEEETNPDWAEPWLLFLTVLEKALYNEGIRIYGKIIEKILSYTNPYPQSENEFQTNIISE